MSDLTRILNAIGGGDSMAAEELLPLVYDELRRLAVQKMGNEAPGQTLQPTALVHEAWLRLVGTENPRFAGRGHFLGAAAEAMRRILIDRARQKLNWFLFQNHVKVSGAGRHEVVRFILELIMLFADYDGFAPGCPHHFDEENLFGFAVSFAQEIDERPPIQRFGIDQYSVEIKRNGAIVPNASLLLLHSKFRSRGSHTRIFAV